MGDFMEQILNNLTKIIKEHNKFIIMTHKNPDFDGMGSAIALQQIINSFGKENYILVNKKELDNSLKKAFDLLSEKSINHNVILKSEVDKYIDEDTVLIILDTHKAVIVEDDDLLNKTEKIVVIDHHIKSNEYIKSLMFNYINSNLSSTVEFICSYLKYLNKIVEPIIATFLLVGLEIDTNNFKLKTTDKTYEAAAFLTRLGADNILKQELLQESMESYIKRSKLIEKSFMINENMALCLADNKIYKKQDLATIAEELLQFENVDASFVIGNISDSEVGVSARSIGNINVEEIMSKLGGGGHMTEAASQIKDKTILEVKDMLKEVI